MKSLVLGCGTDHKRRFSVDPTVKGWDDLIALDIDPNTGCNYVHDLDELPYPFLDEEFDEIHAYEVLEHTGRQGDWRFFFGQFAELHRILKPGGYIYITVPSPVSAWAWGDPGHTRLLPPCVFSWLDQRHYDQVGKTACTDYRPYWKGDLKRVVLQSDDDITLAILRKPE